MRSTILQSKLSVDEISLCRFIDAYEHWAARNLNTESIPDLESHPTVSDFRDIAEDWDEDGLGAGISDGPILTDEHTWDIVTRWHALKVVKNLYADETINAAFCSWRCKWLPREFEDEHLTESERMEWRSAYHRSCAGCIPEHKRWNDCSDDYVLGLRELWPCQHGADDLMYTFDSAFNHIQQPDISAGRVNAAIIRYWCYAEVSWRTPMYFAFAEVHQGTDTTPGKPLSENLSIRWLRPKAFRQGLA